jgi:transcription elongation factor GreA
MISCSTFLSSRYPHRRVVYPYLLWYDMPTMNPQYFSSKEGLEKLQAEYEHRTGAQRAEIAARLKEAKEQGDLGENQEFSDAKEAQSMNEGRIEELKQILDNAVISAHNGKSSVVGVGSHITVQHGGAKREFDIVGAAEADPANGRISNESPLGSAFLGHKKSDKVIAHTPRGALEYTILEVA